MDDASRNTTPMRRVAIILIVVVTGIVILFVRGTPSAKGDPASAPSVTTVELTGTVGAEFAGFYLCDGKRVDIAGALPWTLTQTNLLRLQVRAVESDTTLVADARGGPYGSRINLQAGPGKRTLRLNLGDGGWSCEVFALDWTVEIGRRRVGLTSYNRRTTTLRYGLGRATVPLPPAYTLLALSGLLALTLGVILFVRRHASRAAPERLDKNG